MKSLLTIFTLVFTVMFSSTSFAGWTKVGESATGSTVYVDFEKIRKHGGYVYYWELDDFLKPLRILNGELSAKSYVQGDCKLFRITNLSYVWHKRPMGQDTGRIETPLNPMEYSPGPTTTKRLVLKTVCEHAK